MGLQSRLTARLKESLRHSEAQAVTKTDHSLNMPGNRISLSRVRSPALEAFHIDSPESLASRWQSLVETVSRPLPRMRRVGSDPDMRHIGAGPVCK